MRINGKVISQNDLFVFQLNQLVFKQVSKRYSKLTYNVLAEFMRCVMFPLIYLRMKTNHVVSFFFQKMTSGKLN